jgi:ABC-type transporter Mla subunit MlaD
MPDNNELVNMLRAVIQEEMQSVRQEVRAIVQEELKPVRQELQQVNTRLDTLEAGQTELRNVVQDLRAGQQELKKGQAAIEAALNDLRTINRRTHKEVFGQLNAIWDDIKLLSSKGEKAIR